MIQAIIIRGLTIGTYASGYLFRRLSGFGFPQIDVDIKERGNYDGAILGNYRYSRRVMTIELEIIGENVNDYAEKRRALEQALTLRDGLTEITIMTKDNPHVKADVILNTAFDSPYESGKQIMSDARIEFVAPFPFFKGTADLEAEVTPFDGGGFAIPFEIPLDMSTGGMGLETVVNGGNGIAYPIITIWGIIENPSLANLTTNQTLNINYSLPTISDYIVIDTYKRTALLNGVTNIRRFVSGDWPTINAGNNIIKLTGASSGAGAKAIINYNDYYLGL